jgi:hypothetical protein
MSELRNELLVTALAFDKANLKCEAAVAFSKYVQNHPFYATAIKYDRAFERSVGEISSYREALAFDKLLDDLKALCLRYGGDAGLLYERLHHNFGMESQTLIDQEMSKGDH